MSDQPNINFSELDFNSEFAAAFDALENTGQHLFITGKAGTGKSTLLQYFRFKTQKKIAVLAPTGVAAINIKGQTIHSFFQFKPDITPETAGDLHIRKRKRQMYASLQAVVIDEISMVRADLLDCVDAFLRLFGPHHDRPFGGVQMILFGDLFQLPPVVSRGEEDIFKTVYPTPYFFSANAFTALNFKIMQLAKIYRQKDEDFIHLLNAVRDNSLQTHHMDALNSRFKPGPQMPTEEFYISLTTTNVLADQVNAQHLKNLPTQPKVYQGILCGEFDRKSLPTPESLELKVGAQVMMLNNDSDKRWVNGSLGKITAIQYDAKNDDVLMVQLETGSTVDVKKYIWEIYQYYFDEAAQNLASKVIGHFTQYPLKLAWAVTIHKSQGQTFERVIIDIGWGTFCHGQMYVALSRCTSLEGIILKQPLSKRHVLMDDRILRFMRTAVCSFFILLSTQALAQTPAPPSGPAPLATPASERSQTIAQALSSIEAKKSDPMIAWEEENNDKPYIGLLNEYDITVHGDWSYEEDYHARVKIQKEAAKSLGEWPIYYNKTREEITEIKASVETPDGKRYEAVKIQDLQLYDDLPMYSDMRVKVISLPQVNIGSIIDVQVKTKVARKEILNQFWDDIPYPAIPTKYARHTYIVPDDKPIQFHAYKNSAQPIISKKDGVVTYSFVFEKTGYTEDEDFMPPMDEVAGVLSLSSLNDWKQVADWYRDLMNKNTVQDADISAKAVDLAKDQVTQKDKARAILEFLQDNFRYVSMSLDEHTVEPHPTNEVFKNRYGDCKDLAILARQMLKIAGVEANIGLFSAEANGNPQHSLPNPSGFDHVVLEVNVEGQKYFVDPQAKGFDFGQLPSSYDHAYVFVIEDAGYRFDNIPVAPEETHEVVSSSDITVAEDGSAVFEAHVQLPLEASEDFKETWASTTNEHKDKFFENLEANFTQGGKMIDRQVQGLGNRYGHVAFNLKYESPNAYPLVNDMILLKEAQQGDIPDFSAQKRKYPIFIPSNSLIKNHNVYHIPDGLKVDFVPSNYNLGLDFIQVSANYTSGDHTVTVDNFYRMQRASVPPQRYVEVKKFRDAMYKKNDQYIVLKKKSLVAPEAKEWLQKQ